jgi:hypothetical protein
MNLKIIPQPLAAGRQIRRFWPLDLAIQRERRYGNNF